MLKISRINMKFYHFCGITAVAVLFSFFAKKCNGELIVISRLTNEQKLTEGEKIFCVSDDDDAALVWNGPEKEFKETQTTDFVWSKFIYPFACEFQNSTDCSLEWEESEHWKTVNSKEEPMLPVLDYRWESFREIVINNSIRNQQYIFLDEVKRSFGEIVFSVRASMDIHVFICEKEDPEEGPCFWMIIGGWKNTKSAIRSCADGANPWHQTLGGGVCKDISFDKKYSRDIVSPYEWRTFRINYNATEKKIEIFKGIDKQPFLQGNVPEWYDVNKVSFRSESGTRTRFHFYDYIQTTENNAVISTKTFVQSSNKFCVKLFVGLCVHCSLIVRLVDTDSEKSYHIGRIYGSENSTFNGLLDWRTESLKEILRNVNSNRVKLEVVTELNRDKTDKGHWAIDRLRLCKSDDTITTRSSTLTIKQVKKGNVALNWNELTCQNLFSHEVTRMGSTSIYQDTSRLPEYLKEQTELCGSSCPILGKGWWLCNPTGCTCDRGFKGKSCNDECNNGSYGYNCAKTCEACNEKSCDKVTGSCDEPKARGVQLFQSSPTSATFEPPEVTDLNDTTIMVSQYVNLTLYRNCQMTAHLDLCLRDNSYSWQTLYVSIILSPDLRYSVGLESTRQNLGEDSPLTNNSSNYYTASISRLYRNRKYRIWVSATCVASQNNSPTSFYTPYTTFWTTCEGEHLFRIEPGDTYLTVYKRQIHKCNDRSSSYEITTRKVGSTESPYPRDLVIFPSNVTYPPLDPFSKYEVSIANVEDREDKLLEVIVCTLEAAPGIVTNFKATPTNTTVKLEWEPPEKMNGKLRGYQVSIKMVTLLACEEMGKSTPLKVEGITQYKTVQNLSVTFKNLYPYARYNVTLITFTSKPSEPYLDTFETFPTDIPTAKFSNFNIANNFTELTWDPPEDCTTISGPLSAAALYFSVSGSIKPSEVIHRTTRLSTLGLRPLNLTAFTNYTVRLYALRAQNQTLNPRIYQSLTWITPAKKPPAVTNLTIFDVDLESRTISLRWLPPVPSNGEIEFYQVYLGSENILAWNGPASGTSIMCQLGENFVCARDIIPQDYRWFNVCAKNKDVNDLGCTQPIGLNSETFLDAKPAQPENFQVEPSISGIVNLKWELPKFSEMKIKGFGMTYQLTKTHLLTNSSNDECATELLGIQNRECELYLKPSSKYKISLFSFTNRNISSEVVEESVWTRTAIAFADEKELQVSHNGILINVEIPEIANITKSTKLEVIVNGPITCDAHSNSNQTSVMHLIAANYSAENFNEKQVTIGGSKPIENVGSKCHLHYGESYTIRFKIKDGSVHYVRTSQKINLIDGEKSEAGSNLTWLIILPILVIGLAILYMWNRRRRNTVVRTSTHDDIPLSKTMLTTDISASSDLKIESSPPYDAQEQQMSTSYSAPDVVPHCSNSSHIKVQAFEEYVKECISKNLLDPQYALYARGLTKTYEYGRLPPNVSKNRYKNLTAYDENRVVLDKLPDDPYSDYINASYIQGFRNQKAYIATQGPKPNTVIDFWRMIWQEEVRVICMLANIIENGRIKCEQYWPEVGKKLKYGEVSVLNTNHEVFADYTFRTFQISFAGEKRKVMHLHYTGWPDHGVPTYSQSLVAYLKKLRATRVGNGPVVVHCSAGVGRTGTIILCDICLKQAETDGVIDVAEVMMNLRAGRANMVDNEQQYLLAHLVISESMHSEKTQIPCTDNLPQELKKLKKHLQSDIQRLNGAVWRDRALHSSVLIDRPDGADIEARNSNRHSPIENNQFNIVVVDGVKNKGQYLASKLPSSKTLAQLWKLISEQEIELVIMLQRPNTEDRRSCEVLPGEYIFTPAPNLQLETIARSDDEEHFTTDKLVLTDSSDPNLATQRISVLSCNGWEPGRDGAPPPPAFLVSLWMASEKIPRKAGPAVVLCQDGVTGCGLYLALSFLLERMAVERECDIISAVRAVRRFKPEFVRSVEQFNYLYDAALNYHESFQTYANFS